jgi:hypothetical protein
MNVNLQTIEASFGAKFTVEEVVCGGDIRTLAGCVRKKLMHTLSERPQVLVKG